MQVEQISVFLENRAGRLAEITRVLGKAGVNIRAFSLADTSDFGILRLIVNDNDKAKAALKEHGFTEISVVGASMGGAAVLVALNNISIPIEDQKQTPNQNKKFK